MAVTLTEEERLSRNAYQTAWYQKNRERLNAERAAYRRAEIARDPAAFKTKLKVWMDRTKDRRLARLRQRRTENPEFFRAIDRRRHVLHPERSRKQNLKAKFGLTIDQYEAMLFQQGGKCAACKSDQVELLAGKPKRLAVGHCHATGAVRGLLCTRCNVAIAMVGDDAAKLQSLIDYLNSVPRPT